METLTPITLRQLEDLLSALRAMRPDLDDDTKVLVSCPPYHSHGEEGTEPALVVIATQFQSQYQRTHVSNGETVVIISASPDDLRDCLMINTSADYRR